MENIVSDLFAGKSEPSNDNKSRLGANPTNIKVIGVGGGGGNAVNRMIKSGLSGVEFWLMNTDLQVLEKGQTNNRIQLGATSTRGLGAGNDPSMVKKLQKKLNKKLQSIRRC